MSASPPCLKLVKQARLLPVAWSQKYMDEEPINRPAETRTLLSGKAKARAPDCCSSNRCNNLPVAASHWQVVAESSEDPPPRTVLPSGEKATAQTGPLRSLSE